MARRAMGLLALCMLVLPAGLGEASKQLPEGSARFGIYLYTSNQTDAQGMWTISVETVSLCHASTASAFAEVLVGNGAEVVEGETNRIAHPSAGWKGPADRIWQLRLKRLHDGPLEVTASLQFKGPNGGVLDRSDYRMSLVLEGQEVRTVEKRTTVSFRTFNGQRFRYGGQFPVAMEPDELELPDSYDSAPELLSTPSVLLASATKPQVSQVNVLVTVGKAGNAIWVRREPVDGQVLSDDVWNAVNMAVHGYHFRPAISRGRPVAQNLVLNLQLTGR